MMIALSHTCQGNLALALEAAEAVYRTSAFDAFGTGLLGGILSRLGEKDRAEQVIATMTGAVTIGMTMYCLVAGEIDAALDWYQGHRAASSERADGRVRRMAGAAACESTLGKRGGHDEPANGQRLKFAGRRRYRVFNSCKLAQNRSPFAS
jgi:hypothetical protein